MRIVAMCSVPRVGFLDFMGQSIAAFAQNGIEYRNLFGVFWGQVLSNGMKTAVEENYDYIITTDYDSIYDTETVAQLVRLANQNPHADAICAMQMGRFSGLLVSNDAGELLHKDLKEKSLIPVNTGHFGLTIFRVSALRDLIKPWFWCRPDVNNEWSRNGEGKLDDDIYFWDNFKASGKTLYLAPRLVIGHLELMVKWPDERLEGVYCTLKTNQDHGKPRDVWK